MRPAISTDETTGSSCFQADNEIGSDDLSHDLSYHEALGCHPSDYEHEPMAQVSWADVRPMADRVKVVASKILDGRYHPSGRKIHKRKKRRGK